MEWYDGESYPYTSIAEEMGLDPSYFFNLYKLAPDKWEMLNEYKLPPKDSLIALWNEISELRQKVVLMYHSIMDDKALSMMGFGRYMEHIYPDGSVSADSFRHSIKYAFSSDNKNIRTKTIQNYRIYIDSFMGYVIHAKLDLSYDIEMYRYCRSDDPSILYIRDNIRLKTHFLITGSKRPISNTIPVQSDNDYYRLLQKVDSIVGPTATLRDDELIRMLDNAMIVQQLMLDKKHWIFDLDGTLMNGNSRLTQRTKLYLNKCISLGKDISIATARPFEFVRGRFGVKLIDRLNRVSFTDGVGLYIDRDKKFLGGVVSDRVVDDMLEDVKDNNEIEPFVLGFDHHLNTVMYGDSNRYDIIGNCLSESVNVSVEPISSYKASFIVGQMFLVGSYAELMCIRHPSNDNNNITLVKHNDELSFLIINPKNIHKGIHFNDCDLETIFFGDSNNDKQLMKHIYYTVSPSNISGGLFPSCKIVLERTNKQRCIEILLTHQAQRKTV